MEPRTGAVYQQVIVRLALLRKRLNAAGVVHGVVLTALVLLVSGLSAVVVEEALFLGVVARTIISVVFLLLLGTLLLWHVARPLLRLLGILPSPDDRALAATVGKAFPGIRDRLLNALELYRERQQGIYYSGELIDAAFEDLEREIAAANFASIVSFAPSRRLGRHLSVLVILGALLLTFFPAPFLGSAYRLWNFGEAFAAPAPFSFVVIPGDTEVVKGGDIRITVRVVGELRPEITLASRPEGQTAFDQGKLLPGADGGFTYTLSNVRTSLTYYASAAGIRSREYRLTVTDRPAAKLLRLELRYPPYTGLAPRTLEDNVGDVTALKGTRIMVTVESNKALAEARLEFHDGNALPLHVSDLRASGAMVLVREGTYHVALRDREGTSNADPIEYSLRIVPDAYPTASIVMPGADLDVTDNKSLNMMFRITDDFGFSKLRLAYRLVQSRYEKPSHDISFLNVPLPAGLGVDGLVPFTWNLADLRLVPEDVVSYYVEVFDNDVVSGPKSAVSQAFTLRLPSLDEVFADVSKAHDASVDHLQEALNQSEDARQQLEDLRQDITKNQQKADWEDKKKAEDLAKRYQDIQKKLEAVQQTVDKMLGEMRKNNVLSPETLEKYQELQQLMEQMNSPELAEAMKQLQQAMDQINPDAMKQALDKFQFSEENFRKSIERTMNLLKRIQIEQKLDELARRADDLKKRQEELEEKTKAGGQSPPLGELARQQRDLGKPVEQIRSGMKDLQKTMEDFPGEMPTKELEQARRMLDSSGLDQRINQIAEQMQRQQGEEAAADQQQAAQSMSQLAQQLQATERALRSNQQREVMNRLRGTLQDLLELSKREEALKNESGGLDQTSPRFRENAQSQMDLIQDLGHVAERLTGLSQKTFAVTPNMGKAIGDALRSMGESMQSLDQRNGRAAADQQEGAMGSLNEAAEQVEAAMAGMTQGGGEGMGMAGFMQRLQMLSGQQQGINKGTQNAGGMSQRQAAEMARLAGEQGAVRKSLEELAREAANTGELQRMLGNLNSIAQDMREVQTNLAQGNVNPETLHKQDRILSRLLDSQLALRERDYEKTRKSQTGSTVARSSPPALDPNSQEGRTRLRNDLLRALEEGYAPDYQEMIRKYFEALEQSEQQQP